MPNGSWREASGKTNLSKIFQEIVCQSHNPISQMETCPTIEGWRSSISQQRLCCKDQFGEWGSKFTAYMLLPTLQMLLTGATVPYRDMVVLVLLVACTRKVFVKKYECFIPNGSFSKKQSIPVHKITLPEEKTKTLLAFHANTDFDTMSQFVGIGKQKALIRAAKKAALILNYSQMPRHLYASFKIRAQKKFVSIRTAQWYLEWQQRSLIPFSFSKCFATPLTQSQLPGSDVDDRRGRQCGQVVRALDL